MNPKKTYLITHEKSQMSQFLTFLDEIFLHFLEKSFTLINQSNTKPDKSLV